MKTLETLEKRGRFAQIVRSLKAYYAWRKEHPTVYDAAMDRITRWVPELKDHFEEKVKHRPPASDQLREFVRNNLDTFRARSGDGVLQKLRTRNPEEKHWYRWMRCKCRTAREKADMKELNALVKVKHKPPARSYIKRTNDQLRELVRKKKRNVGTAG